MKANLLIVVFILSLLICAYPKEIKENSLKDNAKICIFLWVIKMLNF